MKPIGKVDNIVICAMTLQEYSMLTGQDPLQSVIRIREEIEQDWVNEDTQILDLKTLLRAAANIIEEREISGKYISKVRKQKDVEK